jgi:small-conductance mechanosensitive channel
LLLSTRASGGLLNNVNLADWWDWLQTLAASPVVLESLGLQIGLIALAFLLAWGFQLATRGLMARLAVRLARYMPAGWSAASPNGLIILAYAWLILVIIEFAAARLGYDLQLVAIAATLTALWVVLRASTRLFRDAMLARLVAVAAWIIAALNITGLLAPMSKALDSAALTLGTLRLSLLMVIKAVLLIALLVWAALAVSRLVAVRLQHLALSPSIQTLATNLTTIALVMLALLIGLNTVGIDLTSIAVFSGAIGVGIGLGLQKIVSNFVSGIILLVERSIKPGDVIDVGHTHGSVMSLGARYTAVRGRDGKEYLIPNEWFITNQVINWSYSSPLVRLDVGFGVGYGSDMRQVRQLAIDAARHASRVVAKPEPVCHMTEFADNSVNFLLRFWIEDPAAGTVNVKGEVFLALWDRFKEHGIELPFPQRDIHVRDLPAEWPHAAHLQSAAD